MRNELIMAESANSLLRESLKNTAGVVADEARRRATQLREHMQVVRHRAADLGVMAQHHLGSKMAASQADRLLREAETVLRQLEERGRYAGPQRDHMSTEEKSAFIRKHGQEKFLDLPS